MKKVNWKDKKLIEDIVRKSLHYREVLLHLGLRSAGGNNETLKRWIEYHNIDTSHFDPYRDKLKKLHEKQRIPLQDILDGKHPQYLTYHLKLKLLEEGIKQNICEECGQEETWNEKTLNMHLDHIDGDSTNHRLKNLRMLCPNCHSQTSTYAGKKRHPSNSKTTESK